MKRTPIPRVVPHQKRVHVAIRLPLWIKDWIDAHPTVTRAQMVQAALVQHYKLKEPKA